MAGIGENNCIAIKADLKGEMNLEDLEHKILEAIK